MISAYDLYYLSNLLLKCINVKRKRSIRNHSLENCPNLREEGLDVEVHVLVEVVLGHRPVGDDDQRQQQTRRLSAIDFVETELNWSTELVDQTCRDALRSFR